jgi:guanylate kinase
MQPVTLVLVGASGVGKTELTKLLVERRDFRRYPTLTTRALRPGEINGQDYEHVTPASYETERLAGQLFNDIEIGGCRYGIQHHLLTRPHQDQRLVLQLVHEWALRLRDAYDGVAVVLIKAPSEAEQRRRLQLRGDDDATIVRRMSEPVVQRPPETGCDLVLVNETGQLEATYQQLVEFLERR